MLSSIAALIVIVILFFVLSRGDSEAYLSISTSPSEAEIIINDKPVGKSPMDEFKIESDVNIVLKISKDGFVPLDTSLKVISGKKENLSFNLIPIKKEQVKFTTNPDGAKLIINNIFAGISPLDNYSIRRGENNIRIEKVGYLIVDTLIKVEKNLAGIFNFNLIKDPDFKGFGTLKITSKPTGVSVILND